MFGNYNHFIAFERKDWTFKFSLRFVGIMKEEGGFSNPYTPVRKGPMSHIANEMGGLSMAKLMTFRRYEKKFMLTRAQYEALIPRLLVYMELDHHCKNHRPYSIYNVYYDTVNFDVIRHSISKPYYKEKLRLRSYRIPGSEEEEVFLELKKKIKGIVSKRRMALSLAEAKAFVKCGILPTVKDEKSSQVMAEIAYYLKHHRVREAVYVGYQRYAYFAKDNPDFRLTFDFNILTRREVLKLEAGYFGTELLGPSEYLMEVKILGAIPSWFTSLLSELRIYPTHFSKYGQEYLNHCQFSEKRREQLC